MNEGGRHRLDDRPVGAFDGFGFGIKVAVALWLVVLISLRLVWLAHG